MAKLKLVPFLCPVCSLCGGKAETVMVPAEGLKKWQNGELIQRAFPTMTPDQREVMLTGIHPKCWDKMTGGDQ